MRSAALKRLFDVAFAAVGLVVLSPVLALIAIAIRLSDRGPVLFRQERIGLRFQPFMMFKFRTMVPGAPRTSAAITIGDDPRVTRLGAFLRRTKLDELPQLFNVLRGEMSMVGPRPELREYVRMYRHDYVDILALRPGITDIASILYRDESRLLGHSEDPENAYVRRILPDKIRLAREYVRRGSVPYDLWLLMTTVVCLLYPKVTIERLFGLLGRQHRTMSAVFQVGLALAAHLLAVDLRFEGRVPAHDAVVLRETLPLLLALRLAAFLLFGLHKSLWRYVGFKDVQRIVGAVTVSSLVFWVTLTQVLRVTSYSRAVFLTDGLLCVLLLAGLRIGRRMQSHLRNDYQLPRRVLVVSSGDATERLLDQIAQEPDYEVIGIVDQDPTRRGLTIHDVPILGTQEDLAPIIAERGPDAIVVEAGSISADQRREITRLCATLEMPVSTVPGFHELLTARPSAAVVSAAEARDLLAREPMPAERAAVRNFYERRRVLVTGAAGTIGSEIARQIADCEPELLVLLDRDAAGLDRLERELASADPELALSVVVADVTDSARVGEVLEEARPFVILHAAGHSHVALMERNPSEAYRTNVLGTQVTAREALRHEAAVYVLVSSDQAVEPTDVVGISRRGAELAIHSVAGTGRTKFLVVRFGSALESRDGLVARLKQQIERGGPVTLAHPDQTRLFITVPEAVHLILQAGTMGTGGEVFVLDMGKPVRVLDMAHTLIRMYGHTPDKDIEVVFTGTAAGERLFEKLFDDHETVWKTSHPRILMALNGSGTSAGRERIRLLMKTVELRIRNGHTADVHATLARTAD